MLFEIWSAIQIDILFKAIEYDGRYSKVSEFLSSNILLPNVLSGQTIYQNNTYSNSQENNLNYQP